MIAESHLNKPIDVYFNGLKQDTCYYSHMADECLYCYLKGFNVQTISYDALKCELRITGYCHEGDSYGE